LARPKKIPEILLDINNHVISNKRQIDLYRDDKGNLNNITIENLPIDNYTFARLSLEDSIFRGATFEGCKFQGSDFTKTIINDCVFKDCNFNWVTITKEQYESNTFENCSMKEINVIS
jgi:uncharacterized protein YjbI with pentapeptide repeats